MPCRVSGGAALGRGGMTADCIGAPLLPRCRDARGAGSARHPAAPRPQPRLGALHRPGGGGVAPVSGRVAACPAVCPGGPGGGLCLSRRGSRPVCEVVWSTPEAKPGPPEALAWAFRCDAGLSGGVGRAIRELLARVSATGAGYAADRRGLCAGLARREIFGLASPSFVLASTTRHGPPGRGAGRSGLWGGWLGRRGRRERFRACRERLPGRRGGRLGWCGAQPGIFERRATLPHGPFGNCARTPPPGCRVCSATTPQGPQLETASAAETRPPGRSMCAPIAR